MFSGGAVTGSNAQTFVCECSRLNMGVSPVGHNVNTKIKG